MLKINGYLKRKEMIILNSMKLVLIEETEGHTLNDVFDDIGMVAQANAMSPSIIGSVSGWAKMAATLEEHSPSLK